MYYSRHMHMVHDNIDSRIYTYHLAVMGALQIIVQAGWHMISAVDIATYILSVVPAWARWIS